MRSDPNALATTELSFIVVRYFGEFPRKKRSLDCYGKRELALIGNKDRVSLDLDQHGGLD